MMIQDLCNDYAIMDLLHPVQNRHYSLQLTRSWDYNVCLELYYHEISSHRIPRACTTYTGPGPALTT